jgi:molybdopterin converting factor small subunit
LSRVSVRLFGGAAAAHGGSETEISGVSNVAELVESLSTGNEQLREVLDQCSFFIDGEHHRTLDTVLPESCQVDVLPPFAGG